MFSKIIWLANGVCMSEIYTPIVKNYGRVGLVYDVWHGSRFGFVEDHVIPFNPYKIGNRTQSARL